DRRRFTERDDVLVRCLGIVLRGRLQEQEMELQLRALAGEEGVAHGGVTARSDAVRFAKTGDLEGRLEDAQLIESREETFGIGVRDEDAPLGGALRVLADVRELRFRRERFHETER